MKAPSIQIELGDTVVDGVTGFTGYVIAYLLDITGRDQIHVQPKIYEGKFVGSQWFDVERVSKRQEPQLKLFTSVGG